MQIKLVATNAFTPIGLHLRHPLTICLKILSQIDAQSYPVRDDQTDDIRFEDNGDFWWGAQCLDP
jgi:hypothetical protein